MDWLELQQRIQKGEDLHTEFKEARISADDLAEAIVAFANTDGGEIVFGVNRTGEVVGIADVDALMRHVDNAAAQNCQPPVTVLQETVQTPRGTVVVVHVPKGDERPYRTRQGFYYIRTTSGRRKASRQELLRLFQASESFFYEETLLLRARIGDIDTDAFVSLCRQFLGEVPPDPERLLVNWRLLREQEGEWHPTVAALLLFGREPQGYLPYAYAVAARVPGTDPAGEPVDAKRIEGTLFEIVEDIARFLRIHLQTPHRIHAFEPETYPELPEAALREIVVNALAHRDYTITAPVRVFVLDDRVEVRSPGGLPNTVTPEMVKAGVAHVLRNPTIYLFFSRAGLVTETGMGFRRTVSLVKKTTGREPDIREEGNETVVVIPRGGEQRVDE